MNHKKAKATFKYQIKKFQAKDQAMAPFPIAIFLLLTMKLQYWKLLIQGGSSFHMRATWRNTVLLVEQTQRAHVGVLEDDPEFLSLEDLSLNIQKDQSKCQITVDTESSDALPQLKIIEQKNQERNDDASSIPSALKELIVDVVVVQDQETGAVSKSENHPHKLQ